MSREIEIRVAPGALKDSALHREEIAQALGISPSAISEYTLIRRSIDARGRHPFYVLRFRVWEGEVPVATPPFTLTLRDVRSAKPAIIVGFGPAGMFAALRLIELGIKPIVLERGKAVRDRRRDIAAIAKRGEVNPESNYCFGEGGAGTFSDGKLYTRSNKRGSLTRILAILVAHGASPEILIDAHPHIGTNKLPHVVEAIRHTILECGGEVHFNTAVSGLDISSAALTGVSTATGDTYSASATIFATGHSARDVFALLQQAKIAIERKAFAVGVRVEHPQSCIDLLQYHAPASSAQLPPASYALRTQVEDRGVFSFCMCPGGIICPAATTNEEVVVNGWSPSKRNSFFANSGMVVEVHESDLLPFSNKGDLAGVAFQRSIETAAFAAGGGKQVAPAVRLTDFLNGTISATLPKCSYLPGIQPADLREVLPDSLHRRLKDALRIFGERRRGYITEDAIVVGVESRTSSPVRIPRDGTSGMHPGLAGLFPCGEGAGYAGGIMSAAMDGEHVAECIARYYGVQA